MSKKLEYKILGYLFLFVAGAAVISVIYYIRINTEQPYIFQTHHKPLATDTYTNTVYGFSVNYDKQYTLGTTGQEENFFRTNGKTLASISIPQSLYPKTNFGSAQATFAVRPNTAAENCVYYAYGTAPQAMTETTTINGNTAYTTSFDGAAAGTAYSTKLYHLPHNNTCYEISLTTGIANIGNYEPGAVTAVNENDLWKRLDTILKTFKFTSTTSSDSIFCGGIAGLPCPTSGYVCVSEGNYPDAGTTCKKK